MSFNLRGNNVPDGSITEAKLADNSVSTVKLQNDAVTNPKVADSAINTAELAVNAVTTTKIADDAITTAKVANDAITIDKVTTNIGTESFFGSEASLFNIGTTLTSVGEFNFIKDTGNAANWKKLSYQVKLASSVGTNTATFKVFVDSVLYGVGVTTTSTTAVVLSENDLDISALSAGSHFVELKLQNSGATDTATLSQVDIFLSKK